MGKHRAMVNVAIVGLAVGLGGAFAGAAELPGSSTLLLRGGLAADSVAKQLAGEWEAQLNVRAADGSLSTAPASMTAKLHRESQQLEIYYEGFAFGKPVEGALVLSYAEDGQSTSFRDNAAQIRGSCSPAEDISQSDSDTLSFSGRTEGKGREIRTSFHRESADAWRIEYQSKNRDGEWEPILTLHVDRMAKGQRSAAADGFNGSPVLAALRQSTASASVDPDR